MFIYETLAGRGYAVLIPSLLLLIFSLLKAVPAMSVPMDDYRWQNRPLSLFSPHAVHPQLQATLEQIEQQRCQFKDRDMVLGVFLEDGASRISQQILAPSQVDTVRERFDVPAGQFAVILIGKDGGEKYRLYEAPELDRIFALIDGMPMRQQEMSADPADCR